MAKNRANRQFWESGGLNNRTYRQYFDRLTELSISMFDWKNLPPNVDVRYLELRLFQDGQAVFFKDTDLSDDDNGFLGLRCVPGGNFDVYGVPTNRRAYGYNGYNKDLNKDNSVIIYNNLLRKNSTLDVEMFSKRLYNIDRIIDVNVNAQKTPVLILCDENERLSMLNLYKQYDGNAPVIFGEKNLNVNGVTALTTQAPFVSAELYELKTQYWNEALTYLGISNVNISKKERLLTDEIKRNLGGVISSRYSRLDARQQACRKINKMFGLNIWVEYREDYVVDFDEDTEEEQQEDDYMLNEEVVKNE